MSAEGGLPIASPILAITNDADHSDKVGQGVVMAAALSSLVTSDTALTAIGVISNGGISGGDDSVVPFSSGHKTRVKLAASPGTIVVGTLLALHTDGTFKASATGKAECAVALQIGTSKGGALIYAQLFQPRTGA